MGVTELLKEKKQELIDELKALRIEKGMTYQDIADKTKENGEMVSLSTVKLVFSDKINHDHDYKNTLLPIANVLMPPSDDDTLEIKTLQTRLEYKDEIIKQYKDRLDAKEQKHKDREQFYMDLIDFLKEQIESKDAQIKFKDEQIQHHNAAMDRKDATIRELYAVVLGSKKIEEVFK